MVLSTECVQSTTQTLWTRASVSVSLRGFTQREQRKDGRASGPVGLAGRRHPRLSHSSSVNCTHEPFLVYNASPNKNAARNKAYRRSL